MDNTQCSNKKCRKKIRNFYLCKPCNKSFCSNSCLNIHNLEDHKLPKSKSIVERSVFMKAGKFLTEIENDSYFDKSKFEFVSRSGKKYLLGEGAFAQIYLAKHKESGKNYAIKQVSKNLF
jgi:hypothetical protein